MTDNLFEYLLRLGDDRLVLGHRLSEWCGHGPILEEDIALANIALDLVGQASLYLKLAGEVAWVNPLRPDGDNPNPGMGVRFLALELDDRERLVEVIRTIAYVREPS